MATFGELQARVRTRVIDLPTAVANEVPLLVNDAIRDFQKHHNYKVMEGTFTTRTVVGQRATEDLVPELWKSWRGKPYVREPYGRGWWLDVFTNISDAELAYGNDPDLDFGQPHIIGMGDMDDSGGGGFNVYPYPDGLSLNPNGEYDLIVPYWRFLPELASSGDTNWFTFYGGDAIIELATSKAFEINWDEDRAVYWSTKAKASEDQLKLLNKRQMLSGGHTMATTDGANEPMFRK